MSETRIYLTGKRRSHIYHGTAHNRDGTESHYAWCGMYDYWFGLEPSTVAEQPLCKNCVAILEAIRIHERIEATGDETVELPLFNVGIDEDWLRSELEDVGLNG